MKTQSAQNLPFCRLISMVEFVIGVNEMTSSEFCEKYGFTPPAVATVATGANLFTSEGLSLRFITHYARFLKRSLDISMFVPVDSRKWIMSKPTECSSKKYINEYLLAEAKILFPGFYEHDNQPSRESNTVWNGKVVVAEQTTWGTFNLKYQAIENLIGLVPTFNELTKT